MFRYGYAKALVPLRVLVVDDLEEAALMLGLIMKRMGHVVKLAHGAREALEKARALEPEVVFLDIGLPDGNGYDVCRALRRQPWGRKALIVAVTGRSDPADLKRSEEAGFDRHVVKPMGFGVLHEIMSKKAGDGNKPRTPQPDPVQ
jgi:CheY-like chemotaxis protein